MRCYRQRIKANVMRRKIMLFLSLNSNIGNTLGYLGWTTSVSVGNTMALTGYAGEHAYELWEGIGQIKSTSGSFFKIYC